MKTKLSLLCALAGLLLFSGCASFIDQKLPEGSAAKIRYVRTGKFSSTTIEADNFQKTAAYVKADRITLQHSNAWLPNLTLTAEGYERIIAPAK